MRFEEFVAAQGAGLLRLAFVLTGDRHLAEDLTQTALADAYRHWRRVAAAQDPVAYVRRMLVNAHLSWRRRRSSTERPAEWVDTSVDPAALPGDALAERQQLRALVAGLPPSGSCASSSLPTPPAHLTAVASPPSSSCTASGTAVGSGAPRCRA